MMSSFFIADPVYSLHSNSYVYGHISFKLPILIFNFFIVLAFLQ